MGKDNNLFYLCSLIEYIGRQQKLLRGDVVKKLGKDNISRIYKYADVFHCEPIEKVANEFIEKCQMGKGNFDNVTDCKYNVPDYWTIGEVYERLIEDVQIANGMDAIELVIEIYTSWLDKALSNYNSDLYYQPREYISLCYKEGKICA